MADLCRQCTREIWGEDESDFNIYPSDENGNFDFDGRDKSQGKVLCEGCGYVTVTRDGFCIDPDCKLHNNSSTGNLG